MSLKGRELTVGFQKRFLNDVRRINLTLQATSNFDLSQQPEITLIGFKQLSKRRAISRASFVNQATKIRNHRFHRSGRSYPYFIVTTAGKKPPRDFGFSSIEKSTPCLKWARYTKNPGSFRFPELDVS